MTARCVVTALFTVCLSACASAPSGPREALDAYASALREGRWSEAWRALSADTRRALPYDSFVQLVQAHPDAVQDAVNRLDSVETSVPLVATLPLADGTEVTLRFESGAWRVDPESLNFYAQRTPRQALHSFVRALERHRWEVLLNLAPHQVRERLDRLAHEETPGPDGRPVTAAQRLERSWSGPEAHGVSELLARLRDALANGRMIETLGDRATMTYGPGGQSIARLVREDGLWRVEDPE